MGDIAARVTLPISRLGGGFMLSREAKAYSRETGFPGWSPYMRGRAGVLGDVDAGVVTAAVGFFPPEVVRENWEAGRSLPAAEAADRYARVCQDFGRRKFAGLAEADRLAELMERVVGAADVAGVPLFAGWRALPLADDALARVSQLAHTLRELRGGLHLAAVLASGLTPLEAVLAGGSPLIPDGAANARYFLWPEPYAELSDDVRKRRVAAEELTDAMVRPAYAVLDDDEGEELIRLLADAERVAFGS